MSAVHRVMFLAGGSWAIVAVGLIRWETGIDQTRSLLGDPVAWHGHEMVFGFAAAMFAGYALTAMASWTGHARMSHSGVTGLLALWVLARLTVAGTFGQDPLLGVAGSVAFMACVTVILARAALRARSGKGAVLTLFALGLTAGQVAVLRGAIPLNVPILGFAALLSVVGGQIVAAFTRNGLTGGARQERCLAAARLCGLAGSTATLLALGLEAAGAASDWVVVCLLLAAAAGEALRALLWLSTDIPGDGLLVMLHIGFAWLPLGLLLVALDRTPAATLPATAALHALTAGALACTIYAVAVRAVARRADRLRAAPIDGAGFVLLWIAAALRIFAPADTSWHSAAPLVWCLAWTVFLVRHGVALRHPAPRPVFSGPKKRPAHDQSD